MAFSIPVLVYMSLCCDVGLPNEGSGMTDPSKKDPHAVTFSGTSKANGHAVNIAANDATQQVK